MESSNIVLPSNKKFGLFFTCIFFIGAGYLYINNHVGWGYIFVTIAVMFFCVSIFKPSALLPLNKLWMRFGFLLGMIVSPILLGIIFFGIFTPISFLMRRSGRDELLLKFKNASSYWILRESEIQTSSFKKQF